MRTSRLMATCPVLGVTLVLAIPTAAVAAQKDVSLGPTPTAQKALQPTGRDVNDFFPHEVRIHVGDKVRFVANGFHTVDLPGRRSKKLPLFTPVAQAISGSVDAAGAPFWFNGQPQLGFNRQLLRSAFGKSRNYDGPKGGANGPPPRAAAEADDRQVQQGRDLPLLLRRPSRHDRDRARRVLEGERPVGGGPQACGGPPGGGGRQAYGEPPGRVDAGDREDASEHSGAREQHRRRRGAGQGQRQLL